MNPKSRKVEEPAAPYIAKRPAKKGMGRKLSKPEVRAAGDAAFDRVAGKIFSERKELLRKLAQ
ncbi:MAG: hypothetical protein IPN11_09975 [Opitutaceae bacterium]|nr:hypothetical protein [Opitutaceae bacterium]